MGSVFGDVLVSVSTVRGPSTTYGDANTTTSSTMVEAEVDQPQLIAQHVLDILYLVFGRVSLPLIEVFGITTNIINLRIFWSLDIRNVVTSCFFFLSMADLCYLLMAHTMTICLLLDSLVSSWVKLDEVSFSMLGYARWSFMISTLITTYIAVQRCCYMTLPFKVKTIFTPTKNVFIITCLCLSTFPVFLPSQTARGTRILWDPLSNSTYVGLWNAVRHEAALEVLDYTAFLAFPITVQIITMACMIILIRSLRKSSEFRKSTASTGKWPSSSDDAKDKSKNKDVQVVKAVTLELRDLDVYRQQPAVHCCGDPTEGVAKFPFIRHKPQFVFDGLYDEG